MVTLGPALPVGPPGASAGGTEQVVPDAAPSFTLQVDCTALVSPLAAIYGVIRTVVRADAGEIGRIGRD